MLQTYNARVKTSELIAPEIYRFVFSLDKPLNFSAGQYILLDVKGGFRQYSISSSPSHTSEIETVVDVTPMGLGSKYLLSLKVGDTIAFRAPLGVFTLKETTLPKIFLATGTGIAPLKSMIELIAEKKFSQPFHLFWGLKSKADIYYQNDFARIQKAFPQFTYHYCLSREENLDTSCIKGHIQDGLSSMSGTLGALTSYEFYMCGRPQMVEEVRTHLLDTLRLDKARVFNEKFT